MLIFSFGAETIMFSFHPRPVPTVAAVLFIAMTMSLGNWQSGRAAEKLRLQPDLASPPVPLSAERQAPEAVGGRRVTVRGRFMEDRTYLLDNRVHQGVPGYHVLVPLKIDAASPMAVLVNRGWIPAGSSRARVPEIAANPGLVEIEGIATIPLARPYVLSEDISAGPVRQTVDIDRIQSEIGQPLQPLVVLQTSAAKDGLVRDWPNPASRADVHRAYAFQWYVMAAVIFALWLVLNFNRKETQD